MRVLELGSYLAPAYAGMLLAEQGHEVTKWTAAGRDPLLSLQHGADLWAWVNHLKVIEERHPREVDPAAWDVVLDNFRPSTLSGWGLDPATLCAGQPLVWVSLRADVGEVSFDLLAQCRSWLEYAPWVPFYVGDTAGGLWLSFKALSCVALAQYGHHVIHHAACLQKMVEGELVLDVPRDGRTVPWDREAYHFDAAAGEGIVAYKGAEYHEPIRDRAWKLRHLKHDGTGRMLV